MSRRSRAEKRETPPDPKFESRAVTKFINNLMRDGKRISTWTMVRIKVGRHAKPVVGEDHEHEQDSEADRRHNEEVYRDEVADVVGEEGPPGRRCRLAWSHHVLFDGRLRYVDPELVQLAHDAGRAPSRARRRHRPNEIPHLLRHRRSATSSGAAQRRPMVPETTPLPPDDRARLDDDECITPS